MKNIFKLIENKLGGINNSKLCKFDLIFLTILIFVYSLLSFYRLGEFKVPETYYNFEKLGNSVELKFMEASDISKLRYYTGYTIGEFEIMTSLDGENYEKLTSFETYSVFSWEDLEVDTNAKYIKFVSTSDNECLGDVQFYDGNGKKISALRAGQNGKELTDELYMVPKDISYLNSAYFDEIYFVRSAYEYLNNISNFEWTHPPLGKLLMTIPILIFGFNPFTFRLMGNVAGILMIPVIYVLAMKIFKNRKWAVLASLLMTFDNFHFAQTRMGTSDSFLVLFIMLSILFMKNYLDLDKKDNILLIVKNLLLSGFFIGCAIAVKWVALYAGLGLAIVFFIDLYRQYKDKIKKFFHNKQILKKILFISLNIVISIPLVIYYSSILLFGIVSASRCLMAYYITVLLFALIIFYRAIINDKYLIKLSIICIISFIILPLVIYCLSYLLFPNVNYYDGSLLGIASQSKLMYDYHAFLTETHPFSSKWYEWPLMYKPVWYYFGDIDGTYKSTIVGIGNPAIWWFGIISFGYILYDVIKTRDENSIFILVFILSTYAPYIFIKRIMFLYHFFIVLPFIMLAIVSFVKKITERIKSNVFYYSYILLVVITFILFYPVVSGIIVSQEYINSLKWLSSWIF